MRWRKLLETRDRWISSPGTVKGDSGGGGHGAGVSYELDHRRLSQWLKLSVSGSGGSERSVMRIPPPQQQQYGGARGDRGLGAHILPENGALGISHLLLIYSCGRIKSKHLLQ